MPFDPTPERIVPTRVGRLTFLGEIRSGGEGVGKLGHYRCDCGVEKWVRVSLVRAELTQSCGCLLRERALEANTTHGKCKTPEYIIWRLMIQRCSDPGSTAFSNYGGRGIVVCDRWRIGEDGKHGFLCFLGDMGPRPSPEHSIDRIDVNADYEPSNCRWATPEMQSNNTRRNRFIAFNGETRTVAQWERALGFAEGTVKRRLLLGWSERDALTEPVRRVGHAR